MDKEKFSVVWWNTSLAPGAKSRATVVERKVVCSMIDLMTQMMQKDFIALGEVSEADIAYIRQNCPLEGYLIESAVMAVGRSSFDTCFIYKDSVVEISDVVSLVSEKGGRTLKYAQRLKIFVGLAKTEFHIFISHWPSRLWCDENHADRDVLSGRLRDAVEVILNEAKEPPHIILLGDYNDEPFAKSLASHLQASRDRNLVFRRKYLMYNPFWKDFAATNAGEDYYCGSYFYKSGEITQWHTFAQIIFSHAFVAAKQWRLNESGSNILCLPGLLQVITDRNEIFDHLPVTGEMERVV